MLLLSSSSLTGYGIHRIFAFAQDAGYTGLDISLNSTNFDLWDEEYLYDLTKQYQLPVISLTAPSKGMSEKKFQKIISIAQKLQVQIITFSPPHLMDKDNAWFGERLKKFKKELHISICIQNVEPKFLFFVIPKYRNATLEQIKTVTGDTSLDIMGIDTGSSMDVIKAQKILGASIKNVFFSDREGMKRGILPGGSGGGISYLPLESFLMKLKTSNYAGYITLKVTPKEIGVGNADRVKQNLEYMKSYYEKHFEKYEV